MADNSNIQNGAEDMDGDRNRAYFEKADSRTLRTALPEDDFLHPELCAKVDHPLCTETQWFGFYIPEENIYALNYLSHRPHMKQLYGGTMVCQGRKVHNLAA